MTYDDPVSAMREQVKAWRWAAEKKMREAREAELIAGVLRDKAIDLDLLADKVERAIAAKEGARIADLKRELTIAR